MVEFATHCDRIYRRDSHIAGSNRGARGRDTEVSMQQQNKSTGPGAAAALIAAFAVTLPAGGPARAADDCIAKPTAPAPQGGHWYYHVDRDSRRTCWYLGAQGQQVRHAASKIAPSEESTEPQASEIAADQPAPPTPIEPSSRQTPAQAVAQGGAPSSSQAAAPTVQWPDPPLPAGAGDGVSTAGEPSMPQAAMVDVSDADQQDAAPAPGPVADPAAAAATATFMRVFLMIGGALAAAGILQQAIFKMVFARRRRIHIERGPADRPWRDARAEMPMFVATQPGDRMRAPVERVDPEVVEDAMRQILRSIERRAA
jgi:hypothetical protein